jgi:ankyrin repeat protein
MLYITVNKSLKKTYSNYVKKKASEYGYKEIAQLLIEKGAEINSQDDSGRTPLIIGNLF